MDSRRYGKCNKKSHSKRSFPFPGKFSCYVDLPSSCPDLVNSPVNGRDYPDKKISAEACQDDPNIAGKIKKTSIFLWVENFIDFVFKFSTTKYFTLFV